MKPKHTNNGLSLEQQRELESLCDLVGAGDASVELLLTDMERLPGWYPGWSDLLRLRAAEADDLPGAAAMAKSMVADLGG